MQDDERNRNRYAEFAERFGAHGVFETSDGAVCRHHPRTMNGHGLAGIQILVRKPAAHRHARVD
jgi:hypothetical protein